LLVQGVELGAPLCAADAGAELDVEALEEVFGFDEIRPGAARSAAALWAGLR
jgi:hypothetical protein